MRTFYVYIVASWTRRIFIGVTSNLTHRVNQHALGEGSAFCRRYRIKRLVYFETYHDVRTAIAREMELKGWRREKKLVLIEAANPAWDELPTP